MIEKLATFFRSLRRRPRHELTAKYDWDFLTTTTWFAVDAEQNVAAFENGMMPPIAMPHIDNWRRIDGVKHWSMMTLREKLIKIRAKVVHHARSVIFQIAEVAVPRNVFRSILERIRRLRLTSVSVIEPPTTVSG